MWVREANKDFWTPNGYANMIIPNVCWLECSFTDNQGNGFVRKIMVLNLRIYQWVLIVAYHKSIIAHRSTVFSNSVTYIIMVVLNIFYSQWKCRLDVLRTYRDLGEYLDTSKFMMIEWSELSEHFKSLMQSEMGPHKLGLTNSELIVTFVHALNTLCVCL